MAIKVSYNSDVKAAIAASLCRRQSVQKAINGTSRQWSSSLMVAFDWQDMFYIDLETLLSHKPLK